MEINILRQHDAIVFKNLAEKTDDQRLLIFFM
jgi:hypothetical protein